MNAAQAEGELIGILTSTAYVGGGAVAEREPHCLVGSTPCRLAQICVAWRDELANTPCHGASAGGAHCVSFQEHGRVLEHAARIVAQVPRTPAAAGLEQRLHTLVIADSDASGADEASVGAFRATVAIACPLPAGSKEPQPACRCRSARAFVRSKASGSPGLRARSGPDGYIRRHAR